MSHSKIMDKDILANKELELDIVFEFDFAMCHGSYFY